jgi:hypothetical protein
VLSIIVLIAAVPVLYGLHRLGLYLESRDIIYYWHKKPSGGSAYNPLQELVQPQVRHVIEVAEQRPVEGVIGGGEPPVAVPIVWPNGIEPAVNSGDADCIEADPPAAGS